MFRRKSKTKTIELELLEKVWTKMFGTLLYYCDCGVFPSGENIIKAFKDSIIFVSIATIDNRIQNLMKRQFKKPKKLFRKQEDNFDDF